MWRRSADLTSTSNLEIYTIFFFIVQGCVPEKVCSVERQGHVRHVLTMNPVDWYVLWNLE